MQTMTLEQLLSDLRAVASPVRGQLRRASELDDGGAALIDLGWTEPLGRLLVVTDLGLDILFATQHIVLDEAA